MIVIDDLSEFHFLAEKPCRSIYFNITPFGWVVINSVIVHGMPGIIQLIMTICLTLPCSCMSKCALHVLGGKKKSSVDFNSRNKTDYYLKTQKCIKYVYMKYKYMKARLFSPYISCLLT